MFLSRALLGLLLLHEDSGYGSALYTWDRDCPLCSSPWLAESRSGIDMASWFSWPASDILILPKPKSLRNSHTARHAIKSVASLDFNSSWSAWDIGWRLGYLPGNQTTSYATLRQQAEVGLNDAIDITRPHVITQGPSLSHFTKWCKC